MDPRPLAALGQPSSFPDLNPVFSWKSRDEGGCGPSECVGKGFRVIQWDSVIQSPRPFCGPHLARVPLRCKWCVEAPSCPRRLPPSGFMSFLSENAVSWEDILPVRLWCQVCSQLRRLAVSQGCAGRGSGPGHWNPACVPGAVLGAVAAQQGWGPR